MMAKRPFVTKQFLSQESIMILFLKVFHHALTSSPASAISEPAKIQSNGAMNEDDDFVEVYIQNNAERWLLITFLLQEVVEEMDSSSVQFQTLPQTTAISEVNITQITIEQPIIDGALEVSY